MISETYIFILYAAVFIGVVILYWNVVKQKKEKTNVISLEEKQELNRLLDYEEMRN